MIAPDHHSILPPASTEPRGHAYAERLALDAWAALAPEQRAAHLAAVDEAPLDERTALQVQRDRAEAAEAHSRCLAGERDYYRGEISRLAELAGCVGPNGCPHVFCIDKAIEGRDAAVMAASYATVRAEAAAGLLSELYCAYRVRFPAIAHTCAADVATCERCALEERVEAALRAAGLAVPGDTEPPEPDASAADRAYHRAVATEVLGSRIFDPRLLDTACVPCGARWGHVHADDCERLGYLPAPDGHRCPCGPCADPPRPAFPSAPTVAGMGGS